MKRGGWLALGAAGFVVMVLASAWAPVQPEMMRTGGACRTAPCGTLEDPERWRQAWVVWFSGALVAAASAPFILSPRRPRWGGVLLSAGAVGLVVVPVAVLAYVLSLSTSVQGGATAVVGVPIAAIALLGSWVRAGWRTS